MKLAEIASRKNLTLAWRRITTGLNQQYKRYYRDLYYTFEIEADSHLKELGSRLQSKSYRPATPQRIYLPKPTGLQRPLTLLHLEDQIVLQAIANLATRRVSKRRYQIQRTHVFLIYRSPLTSDATT